MAHKIIILGSMCNINNMYLDLVDRLARSLNVDYEIEKIEDEEVIAQYGVSINCVFGMCPGCRQNNAVSKGKHTPALVIDQGLIFHSKVPEEEKLIKILSKLKKNN